MDNVLCTCPRSIFAHSVAANVIFFICALLYSFFTKRYRILSCWFVDGYDVCGCGWDAGSSPCGSAQLHCRMSPGGHSSHCHHWRQQIHCRGHLSKDRDIWSQRGLHRSVPLLLGKQRRMILGVVTMREAQKCIVSRQVLACIWKLWGVAPQINIFLVAGSFGCYWL